MEFSVIWLLSIFMNNYKIPDYYADYAKKLKYRSRAAFKLLEIQQKFNIIKKYDIVADLGSAPGSWLQVIQEITNNLIVGIDIQKIIPINEVLILQSDIANIDKIFQENLEKKIKFNAVLSDMAPNTTSCTFLNHIMCIDLAYLALNFCHKYLKNNGSFVCKIFSGASENKFVQDIKTSFKRIKRFKPKASRSNSTEIYIVALEFIKGIDL